MIDIPRDIWLHIATFLPVAILRDLIGLNSVFFDLAMDARYRVVSISYTGPKTTERLARLTDPAVARRVHDLNLNPFFDQVFVHKWEKKYKDSFWRRRMRMVMKRGREERMEDIGKYTGSLERTIQATIDALSCLTNVTEFTIGWALTSAGNLQLPVLPAAWNAFGANLRKLSLGGTLGNVRALISSAPRLAIQELDLEFTDGMSVIANGADTAILLDVVAPFINDLSPTLQHLSISSWASPDLSSFFNKLGTLPSLRRLSLHLTFNKAFQADPSGLTRLLHDHSEKLHHVGLRLNPSGAMINPFSENTLADWMTQTTADERILANLQTLNIYPTLLPRGFDSFMVYLRRSADTLSSLTVRDHYLLYDEVDAIVTVFSHRPADTGLKALRMNVRTLSPRLIDLLATKLPGLGRVTLYLGDGRDAIGGAGVLVDEPVVTAEDFRADMQTRKYNDWSLYDIGFFQGGSRMDRRFMGLMAKCIPSVRSFWGQVAVNEAWE